VLFNNVQRSDSNAHCILERFKDHDIIFLAEPHIFRFHEARPGTAQHPNFHLLNHNLNRGCRILAYSHKKLGLNWNYSIADHHIEILIGGCRITGVYGNLSHSPDELHALLNTIKPHPKSFVFGDFNAHHPLWSNKSSPRGQEVAHWGHQMNLNQIVLHGSTTWRRGDATSTLDLIFVNPMVLFRPLLHHLSFLTSDHCILAGEVSCQRPATHLYTTTDWDFFTEYTEDPPPYTSHTFGQAFQDLKDLVISHRLTKRASSNSKKCWDEEINIQLNRCRKAKTTQDLKSQKKTLTKLIRGKKRSCWGKFLQENGKKDPCDVVRIAKDPFHVKARLHSIKVGDKTLTSQQDILEAFKRQHLLSDQRPPTPAQLFPTSKPCHPALPNTVRAIFFFFLINHYSHLY